MRVRLSAVFLWDLFDTATLGSGEWPTVDKARPLSTTSGRRPHYLYGRADFVERCGLVGVYLASVTPP